MAAPLRFYTVVEKTGPGPGGWQEACLEALMTNMTTQDSHVCAVGIGMPIESRERGYIAQWDAAEIATACINKASESVVLPAPPETPAAQACLNFKTALSQLLNEQILGSRVSLGCRPGIASTRIGF
jgi:hypothetical protein